MIWAILYKFLHGLFRLSDALIKYAYCTMETHMDIKDFLKLFKFIMNFPSQKTSFSAQSFLDNTIIFFLKYIFIS